MKIRMIWLKITNTLDSRINKNNKSITRNTETSGGFAFSILAMRRDAIFQDRY
jgi:hypothetical protein